MARHAVESFKNSNNLFDMAEFLQRGFECDGGKVSNSGPRGTREVINSRKEILENIENQDTNNLHFILDATGILTPISDLINAGMYAAEGDLENATLSAFFAVPIAGDFAEIGKIANKGNDLRKAARTWKRMTSKEATEAANKLGYVKVKNIRSKNGEAIYYNSKTKTYISQDIGSRNGMGPHNGGVWKMAKSPESLNSKRTRMGTYDESLKRIGD